MTSIEIKSKVIASSELEVESFFKKFDTSCTVLPAKQLTPAHQAWVTVEYVIQKNQEEIFVVRISFNSKPSQYSTFLQEYAAVTLVSKKDLGHFSFSKSFSFNPLDANVLMGYKDNFKDEKSVFSYIKRLEEKIQQGVKVTFEKYLKSLKSSQLLSSVLNEIIHTQYSSCAEPQHIKSDTFNSYVKLKIHSKVYNTSLYEAQDHCYLLTISEAGADSHCIVYRFIRYTPVLSFFCNIKAVLRIGAKLLKNKYYYKKSPFVREISKELEGFISDAIAP